jgi:hypothetical protein
MSTQNSSERGIRYSRSSGSRTNRAHRQQNTTPTARVSTAAVPPHSPVDTSAARSRSPRHPDVGIRQPLGDSPRPAPSRRTGRQHQLSTLVCVSTLRMQPHSSVQTITTHFAAALRQRQVSPPCARETARQAPADAVADAGLSRASWARQGIRPFARPAPACRASQPDQTTQAAPASRRGPRDEHRSWPNGSSCARFLVSSSG